MFSNEPMPHLIAVPPTLTVVQLFRLVEIAHETTDLEVRKAAKAILEYSLRPDLPMMVKADAA